MHVPARAHASPQAAERRGAGRRRPTTRPARAAGPDRLDDATPPVTIPSVAVTQADGTAIKAAIAAGPKTGSIQKNPAHTGIRDGDLDNGIIIHEYGHGVSNRLTGGPSASCLGGNEQAGEGWSDYLAMTLPLDPRLDNPDVARAAWARTRCSRPTATAPASARGRTRATWSIQPFTYDSIKTNGWLNGTSLALPHGLGHGWASVLWDMNWDLIDKYGYNRELYAGVEHGRQQPRAAVRDRRAEAAGLQPRPGRRLAGDHRRRRGRNDGPADTCTVWATFARRGLGYSAVQGTTARDDNSEAFDTHPDCLRGFDERAARAGDHHRGVGHGRTRSDSRSTTA